ncbi:hypothetical protein [Methyloprofundus sedimenti]|uniref:hypothetical protein n=1 Tax=Methyloprofundus sedimenti TaxID=1420851 RepID=UPI0018E9402B|nr:hypothetical protein [Methyloprofundus sedimenti]
MTEYQKNILVGALFIAGILSIISGAFIITLMLAAGIIFFSTARRTTPLEN